MHNKCRIFKEGVVLAENNMDDKGKKDLNTYSPRVYDVVKVLGQIMTRVGTDGKKIKNELYNVKDYQGLADVYSMDANGDMTAANYTVKEYKDGKAVVIK